MPKKIMQYSHCILLSIDMLLGRNKASIRLTYGIRNKKDNFRLLETEGQIRRSKFVIFRKTLM